MLSIPRHRIALVLDSIAAALSFPVTLWLRVGRDMWAHSQGYLWQGMLGFTALFIVIAVSLRLSYSAWRYVSLRELITIEKVVIASVGLFYLGMFLWNRLEMVPRSSPFIHVMVLSALLAGPRVLYRAYREHTLGLSARRYRQAIPVLVVGYKYAAEAFVRAMQHSSEPLYRVVGLIEEEDAQQDRMIHGVRILGRIEDLPRIVSKLEVKGNRPQKVILSGDYLAAEMVNLLLEQCELLGLSLARLPKMTDLRAGAASGASVRPVAIEDLLGRPQNIHDRDAMRGFLQGRVILITGAGGSIGGELSRQVAAYVPSCLIVLDASEFNLYSIDRELRELHPQLEIVPLLADVRDSETIQYLFEQYRPDVVFHAAAIKHVPLSEINPETALLTNVFGSHNVARAASTAGVKAMVMISTDKAVNPANVMGASKRLAERFCQAFAREQSATKFMTVRFGNVLGSTGSVVPLFQKQLEGGGPLTVTHPDMVRYFMTIREAVELVIQAAVLGSDMQDNGLIFVLDMGTPVKIREMAEQMIRLAGLRPHEDIEIRYTGLRAGEKLYEELFYNSEELVKTPHASIMLAQADVQSFDVLLDGLSDLKGYCQEHQRLDALAQLKKLVPDYIPAQMDA
jgi:FlaA1/EpsC-like NDP-sugar epimerase